MNGPILERDPSDPLHYQVNPVLSAAEGQVDVAQQPAAGVSEQDHIPH